MEVTAQAELDVEKWCLLHNEWHDILQCQFRSKQTN